MCFDRSLEVVTGKPTNGSTKKSFQHTDICIHMEVTLLATNTIYVNSNKLSLVTGVYVLCVANYNWLARCLKLVAGLICFCGYMCLVSVACHVTQYKTIVTTTCINYLPPISGHPPQSSVKWTLIQTDKVLYINMQKKRQIDRQNDKNKKKVGAILCQFLVFIFVGTGLMAQRAEQLSRGAGQSQSSAFIRSELVICLIQVRANHPSSPGQKHSSALTRSELVICLLQVRASHLPSPGQSQISASTRSETVILLHQVRNTHLP